MIWDGFDNFSVAFDKMDFSFLFTLCLMIAMTTFFLSALVKIWFMGKF